MKQALDGQSSTVIAQYLPLALKANKICERHRGTTLDGEMACLQALVVARGLDAVLWDSLVIQCCGYRATTAEVTYPNGGEVLTVGTPIFITWTGFGPNVNVAIDISRDGGGTWGVVDVGTPNDGSYAWTPGVPVSAVCLMRVRGIEAPSYSDTSDAVFEIQLAPVFALGLFDIGNNF